MSSRFAKEIQVAKQAAVEASAAILKYYRQDHVDVTHKSAEQPLTEADLESNRIIRTAIKTAFPDDGWLSEEDPDDAGRLQKSRVWIVDPLDGTKEFINKNPEFALSIGLVEDGVPVLGVVANPATAELFWGVTDVGAFCGDKPIHVTDNRDITNMHLICSLSEWARGEWERFKPHFHIQPVGSAAYKLALVAMGRADACFTLQPKSEWDICGGHAIVAAAGGVVTTADGGKLSYNSSKPRFKNLIYSNPHFHQYILDVIKDRSFAAGG
jgi:myo-inositol-1(or 4)-monophosphatase